MKKLVSAAAGMLLALLTVVGLVPAASAYPDNTPAPAISADHKTVVSGGTWTATATANVKCDWTLEWNGQVRTKAGSNDFSTVYHAPKVKKTTQIELHATCAYDDTTTSRTSAAAASPWTGTVVVTVVPSETLPTTGTNAANAPGDEDLPNTGGPNMWFLLAGVALLVTGTGAVLVARRRAENGDTFAGLS